MTYMRITRLSDQAPPPAACVDQWGWGDMEDMNGNGPAGNEVPYWRIVSGSMTFFWPSIGLSSGQAQTIDPAVSHYMVQGSSLGLNIWTVATANPDTGTYHLRASTDNSASAKVGFGDSESAVDNQLGPVKFDITEGETWKLIARIAVNGSLSLADELLSFNIWTGDSGGATISYSDTFVPQSNDGAYHTYTLEWTFAAGTFSGHTMFAPAIDWSHEGSESTYPTVDVDNVEIQRC